jgi:hypothetical protein
MARLQAQMPLGNKRKRQSLQACEKSVECRNVDKKQTVSKAKPSSKAAGGATPGLDMDTAAAVQQLFTLTPAVASQRATPKVKPSAKAAGGATPGLDMDTAAAVQQLFTPTSADASKRATPKAKPSAKAAGGATPGLDMDTAAAVQQLFTLTPAIASQGDTPHDMQMLIAQCQALKLERDNLFVRAQRAEIQSDAMTSWMSSLKTFRESALSASASTSSLSATFADRVAASKALLHTIEAYIRLPDSTTP